MTELEFINKLKYFFKDSLEIINELELEIERIKSENSVIIISKYNKDDLSFLASTNNKTVIVKPIIESLENIENTHLCILIVNGVDEFNFQHIICDEIKNIISRKNLFYYKDSNDKSLWKEDAEPNKNFEKNEITSLIIKIILSLKDKNPIYI